MLPKKVRIAGFDYEVTETDGEKKVKPKEIGRSGTKSISLLGLIDYNEQTIEVRTDRPKDGILHTFLHEVIHGIVDRYNVPMPEDTESMEEVVDSISAGLLQVLKDNPEIPKLFIME